MANDHERSWAGPQAGRRVNAEACTVASASFVSFFAIRIAHRQATDERSGHLEVRPAGSERCRHLIRRAEQRNHRLQQAQRVHQIDGSRGSKCLRNLPAAATSTSPATGLQVPTSLATLRRIEIAAPDQRETRATLRSAARARPARAPRVPSRRRPSRPSTVCTDGSPRIRPCRAERSGS